MKNLGKVGHPCSGVEGKKKSGASDDTGGGRPELGGRVLGVNWGGASLGSGPGKKNMKASIARAHALDQERGMAERGRSGFGKKSERKARAG